MHQPHQTKPGSSVVPLPTAAPKRVRQPQTRAARAAKAKLERCPAEFIFPSEREMMPVAQLLLDLPASPELELLTAMLPALDEAALTGTMFTLISRANAGHIAAAQALAILGTRRLTVGQQNDLSNATRRLQGRTHPPRP